MPVVLTTLVQPKQVIPLVLGIADVVRIIIGMGVAAFPVAQMPEQVRHIQVKPQDRGIADAQMLLITGLVVDVSVVGPVPELGQIILVQPLVSEIANV